MNSQVARGLPWWMNLWNWKAGVMSAAYRAPIFFITSMRAGWRLAASAMLAETVFRVITSGFYGAITQAIRKLEPVWLAVVIILVLAPAAVQVLELGVHFVSHTPNLKTGIIVSTTMTAIASLFNWYAMRHGTMLTGSGAPSLGEDLKKFPRLIYGFLSAIPGALVRRVRSN